MHLSELVAELGANLGISLQMSDAGTCRVIFGDDAVDFEQSGETLYIMAELAPATGREDAYARLLAANWLGAESGGACIGLDEEKNSFALWVTERGDVPYPEFEARLTLFIKALRYWKEWLSLPAAEPANQTEDQQTPDMYGMIRV